MYLRNILGAVAREPMDQLSARLLRRFAHHSPIGLLDFPVLKKPLHTLKALARLGKQNQPANGPIEPMHHPNESTVWLIVFFGEVLIYHIFQRLIRSEEHTSELQSRET